MRYDEEYQCYWSELVISATSFTENKLRSKTATEKFRLIGGKQCISLFHLLLVFEHGYSNLYRG